VTSAPVRTALTFRALEHVFEVRTADDDLARRVADVYRDLAVPGPATAGSAVVVYELVPGTAPGFWQLLCDGDPVFGDATASRVLGLLLWHVNAQATQRPMPGHVVLHAAAATWAGRAVVLPAPMESGKTTTVTGLLLAGFGYLTDEAAAVSTADLHVEPFHKSLSVDDGSWQVLAALRDQDAGGMPSQWQVPVSSIAASSLSSRTPVAYVVLPKYVAGADTALTPISRAEAVLELCASTFQFLDDPVRNLEGLAALCRSVECYRLTVGDLDAAVAEVRDLVSAA
jgi:hypothetical protein